jgi:hypothetical protein
MLRRCACATLAACGVDGEPEPPTRAAHAPAGQILMARALTRRAFSNFSDRADTRLNPQTFVLTVFCSWPLKRRIRVGDRLTWKRFR